MKRLCLPLLIYLLVNINSQAQNTWRAKLFVHFLDGNNQIVTDTVWFGADSLGDIGYQPGLDVIDTAASRNKVFGFDINVQQNYMTGCVNLKQNIQHLKKGKIDFTLYALGRVIAISWDTLDFIYKSDTNYWLTSAYLLSKNAYLGAIDMTAPIGICGLVDAAGNFKFNPKDSIPVYSEDTTISSCNFSYPVTHIELRAYFGYYDPTVGTENYELDNVNLYPIPCNEIIQLQHTNDMVSEAVFYTLQGQIALKLTIDNISKSINTTSLTPGVYYLNLSTNSSLKYKPIKIVKL